MSIFNLALNPFAVLGVSPRSNAGEMSDARSDRLFDGNVAEEAIEAAFSELTVESRRLPHELSWLTDMAPGRASAIIHRISSVSEKDVQELSSEGAQLSRTNLLAHLLGRFPDNHALVQSMLAAHSEIVWPLVRKQIDETRQISGFPLVRDAAWQSGRKDLMDKHARALSDAITTTSSGPELLAKLMANREHQEGAADLLERVVNRYDRWTIPQLERISTEIQSSLERLKSDTVPRKALEALDQALARWDRLSQPAQLRPSRICISRARLTVEGSIRIR